MAIQRQSVELPTDLKLQLDGFAKKIRNQILRKGLKRWATVVKALIKSNLTVDDDELKRNIRVKTKSYRRGSKIWIGVGVKDNGARPNENPGLRVAMYEGGYRVWPKGRKTNRKGRGWRSGLRRIVSQDKINRTKFMAKSQEQSKSLIVPSIREEINAAIQTASQKSNGGAL